MKSFDDALIDLLSIDEKAKDMERTYRPIMEDVRRQPRASQLIEIIIEQCAKQTTFTHKQMRILQAVGLNTLGVGVAVGLEMERKG